MRTSLHPSRGAVLFLLAGFLVSACRSQAGHIVAGDGSLAAVSWSEEERAREIALKTLRTTNEASYHLVRLRGAEKLHVHDTHDVTVFLLSGSVSLTVAGRTVELRKGDVVEIPRGTAHQAVNLAPDASLAYAVFTPPYDGQDHRAVRGS